MDTQEEKQDITISFKTDSIVANELERRAKAISKDLSKHLIAKQMVYRELTEADYHGLHTQVSELWTQVQLLRFALATAVTALLVQAGKVEDPKDAESWVRKNLLG
jgi:hypothetical protein